MIRHLFSLFSLFLIPCFTVLSQVPTPILEENLTSFGSQNNSSQIVQSDQYEVLVCWKRILSGKTYSNLYLQKLDRLGEPKWEADGVPICPVKSNQDNFHMISDGYGGAVIVWEDYREGADKPKVYMQRINLRGEALWGYGGIPVCSYSGAQRNPKVVRDFKHGFYVVWEDSRMGMNEVDLFAQHVNLAGQRNWMRNGLPIVTSRNLQQHFQIASDENHYLYIVWEDFRNGVYWNLYGQKLDREGNYFWPAGGLDIYAGVEENHHRPTIVPDGYGGLLMAYQKWGEESNGYDIYRARLNQSGSVVYHFATCYSQDDQVNPILVKKGSKAVICWEDKRYGNWDIYGQMIRISDGILEWQVNGVPVVKGEGDDRSPQILTGTLFNYQIFSWLTRVNGKTYFRAQKINNLGEQLWDARGTDLCSSTLEPGSPRIISDNEGGLWGVCSGETNVQTRNIFLQRVNGQGRPLLTVDGVQLGANHKQVSAQVRSLRLISTRKGEFFMAWEDFRNGPSNPDIYLQKITSDGKPAWRNGGLPVCSVKGEQTQPELVEDGVGGVILIWSDQRNGQDDNLYAQRINSYGKVLWRYNGVPLCKAPRFQGLVQAVPDGKEGVVLCWSDGRTLKQTGFDLYVQRIDHAGELYWGRNGRSLSNFPGLQSTPSMTADEEGGAYLCWMDNRRGISNIYFQHINSFGFPEWTEGGKLLQYQDRNQRLPKMIKNFEHDLYLVWEDARYGDGNEKIIMQCIAPNGNTFLWGSSGQLVCNYPGRQSKPKIATDESGNFLVSWLDERSKGLKGVQLYTQFFDIGGRPLWEPNGIALGQSMEENNAYSMLINSKGYSYYLWNQTGLSSKGKKLYYQKLYPNGQKKFGSDGVRIGSSQLNQLQPVMAINPSAQVLLGWISQDPSNQQYGIKIQFATN